MSPSLPGWGFFFGIFFGFFFFLYFFGFRAPGGKKTRQEATARKDRKEGRREERKEGGRAGRKEGGREGRKEGTSFLFAPMTPKL